MLAARFVPHFVNATGDRVYGQAVASMRYNSTILGLPRTLCLSPRGWSTWKTKRISDHQLKWYARQSGLTFLTAISCRGTLSVFLDKQLLLPELESIGPLGT